MLFESISITKYHKMKNDLLTTLRLFGFSNKKKYSQNQLKFSLILIFLYNFRSSNHNSFFSRKWIVNSSCRNRSGNCRSMGSWRSWRSGKSWRRTCKRCCWGWWRSICKRNNYRYYLTDFRCYCGSDYCRRIW